MKLKILITLLLLAGCSAKKENIPSQTIEFVQNSGKVEVEFKHDQWVKIQASGTASILVDHSNDIEQAMNVATLRAKASLIEFLNTGMKSTKSSDNKTLSLIDGEKSSSISSQIIETIVSESNGILKGVTIVERKISDNKDYVMVTIMVDKRSIEAAKKITGSF